jgi:hypothetical protein
MKHNVMCSIFSTWAQRALASAAFLAYLTTTMVYEVLLF